MKLTLTKSSVESLPQPLRGNPKNCTTTFAFRGVLVRSSSFQFLRYFNSVAEFACTVTTHSCDERGGAGIGMG